MKLDNVQLDKADDTLRCANDSTLETSGEVEIKVEKCSIYFMMEFTIKQHMSPVVIGGIGLQQQFGIELNLSTKAGTNERQDHICKIEAKFGRTINDLEWF